MKRFEMIVLLLALGLVSLNVAGEPAQERNGLPLVFHEGFADPARGMARFSFDDPAAWKVIEDNGKNVLALTRQSKYKPPVRTPVNRCLIKDLWVGPFMMEVKLRSTVKDYGHRDLCLFFGNQDDAHQFYVHLGKVADPHCNNIFIVNGADRVAVATKTSKGTNWSEAYHVARIERDAEGSTKVYFDDELVMTAEKKEFPVGRLGVGTFDDLGNFAEITVWGKKEPKP